MLESEGKIGSCPVSASAIVSGSAFPCCIPRHPKVLQRREPLGYLNFLKHTATSVLLYFATYANYYY